ncbi:carbamoyltransferase HypF [Chitiniphilus shinanonensis]|uniref:Carbamoyltransferase HypF n=1 Tax=Chitiniphilus shinanonensis TaxID=553088 RepID=F8WSV2_9NEIS|nr:carbamoyltransferase HypF [Chitiniphilus shinanonensis]BAK53939.1 hydrogenase maturation protein HypF [Chitiniphilus shinanonensis]GLS05040.1 carbamoyltransferase HypF [Chitiniphilus shinanonensis]
MDTQRQRLTVRGIVQGVGFRPFVYRLAHELALNGWVRNDGQGVTLEIEGSPIHLAQFADRLRGDAPPLARIDRLDAVPVAARRPFAGFRILHSDAAGNEAAIGADSCTCPACLAELFDPADRRYRYAFINCTDCGPRYTLVSRLPYDRANTSMAAFAQCAPCRNEYTDPLHRRFHAEPNACPDCGPQLQLLDATGAPIAGDAIAQTLALIARGGIVAIKGLGGFHLVCDARNATAVATLRARKQREEKPLAVMVANGASLAGVADANDAERAWLTSAARPIVLVDKTTDTDRQLAGVAPHLASIGVMLPYTPIHYLLFHEAAGRPAGVAWLEQPQSLALVMTSANPHGEPLVIDNREALAQLSGIADAFLQHDRDIVVRCDDSVVRVDSQGAPQFVRRARGYTPRAVPLATAGAPVLALGGFFKNTLCLTRGDQAFLSQYIGDLDRVANCLALEAACEHLMHLLHITPQLVAHDRHPDFFSTQLASRLAAQWQVPCIAVQHHHAHIAAVLAEHGLDQPVLGLALDGVGLGDDGTAWGGELLRVDGADYRRLGHLRPIAMPGADRAAREPWRMAAAALAQLGRADEIATRFAAQSGAGLVAQLLARPQPLTTSMGRYFDAAAGLLGLAPTMRFEAQAAMLLEGAAAQHGACAPESGLYRIDGSLQLDLSPLLARLADCDRPGYGAALFHAVLVEALADWVAVAAAQSGVRTVAGGGGCFLNALLRDGLHHALARRGLTLYTSQAVPCGDGGLALGQAWVARRMAASQAGGPGSLA